VWEATGCGGGERRSVPIHLAEREGIEREEEEEEVAGEGEEDEL
jgi:hypothetical protein